MSAPSRAEMHPVMKRQLDGLADGDLDALMSNYTSDAVLVRFDGSAVSADEIRKGLTDYLAMRPEVITIRDYAQTDDVIFYRATMRLGGKLENSFGTLIIRNGKIWRQTAGFGD